MRTPDLSPAHTALADTHRIRALNHPAGPIAPILEHRLAGAVRTAGDHTFVILAPLPSTHLH